MKKRAFVAGIVLGAVTSAVVHLILFRPPFPFPPGPPPEKMGRMMFDRLAEDLMLTPEQRSAIEPIMLRVNLAMWESRLKSQWAMEGILDEADKEMLPHLSESQRQRLRELRDRMRESFKRDQEFLEKRRAELGVQR